MIIFYSLRSDSFGRKFHSFQFLLATQEMPWKWLGKWQRSDMTLFFLAGIFGWLSWSIYNWQTGWSTKWLMVNENTNGEFWAEIDKLDWYRANRNSNILKLWKIKNNLSNKNINQTPAQSSLKPPKLRRGFILLVGFPLSNIYPNVNFFWYSLTFCVFRIFSVYKFGISWTSFGEVEVRRTMTGTQHKSTSTAC